MVSLSDILHFVASDESAVSSKVVVVVGFVVVVVIGVGGVVGGVVGGDVVFVAGDIVSVLW